MEFALKPFAKTSLTVESLGVSVERTLSELKFRFDLANASGVRIPPIGDLRRGKDLWKRTCFEVFLGVPDSPEYFEWNFAPSGEWDYFSFADVRTRSEWSRLSPLTGVRSAHWSQGPGLQLELRLGLGFSDRLEWALANRRPLEVGLTAVLEASGGELSYWATRHQANQPEFHARTSFATI